MTTILSYNPESDLFLIAFCVLIGIIALQQIYISKIKKLSQSSNSNLKNNERSQIIDQIFTVENTLLNCPFAICIADKNQIIWTNNYFQKICNQKEVFNFSDFDQLLGTQASKTISKNNSSKPFSFEIISKPDNNPENWKRYTSIIWQVAQNSQMILFIEQTKNVERKIAQGQFEYELINFLLSNCSDQHLKSLGHLKTIIPQIREPKNVEIVNLVDLILNNNQLFRAAYKKLSLQIITSLPHSANIVHNSKDFNLAYRLIMNAVLNRISSKDQITISTYKDKKRLILNINIKNLEISSSEIMQLFNFSTHLSPKEENILSWKFNLSAARQILLNYNSNIIIKSNSVNGTTISVSCISSK